MKRVSYGLQIETNMKHIEYIIEEVVNKISQYGIRSIVKFITVRGAILNLVDLYNI